MMTAIMTIVRRRPGVVALSASSYGNSDCRSPPKPFGVF
jgi:hypothetical protein